MKTLTRINKISKYTKVVTLLGEVLTVPVKLYSGKEETLLSEQEWLRVISDLVMIVSYISLVFLAIYCWLKKSQKLSKTFRTP